MNKLLAKFKHIVLQFLLSKRRLASLPRHGERRLNDDEWHSVLMSPNLGLQLVSHIREGILTPWGSEILNLISEGTSVIEIGSGTGEISLHLAMKGRKVTLLDRSLKSLMFARQCADELGVSITTVESDALHYFPFMDRAFDWAWSSGLLEHFTSQERQHILRKK